MEAMTDSGWRRSRDAPDALSNWILGVRERKESGVFLRGQMRSAAE